MYDGRFRRLANLMGQEIILWTISSRDWRYGVSPRPSSGTSSPESREGTSSIPRQRRLIRNEGGDRRDSVSPAQVIEALQARAFRSYL